MSHHHAKLLRALFHDPPSGNIHWRELESLLLHLGAALEPIAGTRLRVKLNRVEEVLHRPHHGSVLEHAAVKQVREFLARAGATPAQYEAKRE